MHEELGLSRQKLLDMYYYMQLSRKIDERLWVLNRAGSIPFTISSQGHEGISIGTAFAMDREKDWLCPYYRDLGMVLAFGQTAHDQLLSAFSRKDDPNSGGRQMPMHFGDHRYRILSGSSPVATQSLHAVGIAYAGKLDQKDHVVLTSCGEGSSNQGDWHEACNFAGVHQLPVIFLVENNQYAISVPLDKQVAGGNIAARGAGYGFPGIQVDGRDVFSVYKEMKKAVARARAGEGPTLIEAVTYRMTPHSSDDDDSSYRTKEEVAAEKKKDPIILFREYLYQHEILDTALEEEMNQKITQEVNEATDYAEQAPPPEKADLYKHVYG